MTAQCSETAVSFAAIAPVRDDSNPTSRDLTFRIVQFLMLEHRRTHGQRASFRNQGAISRWKQKKYDEYLSCFALCFHYLLKGIIFWR
jgi:hypothetical protein